MATEAEKQARDEQLEAILGLKMMHPNIVRTFQFATKDRSVRLLSYRFLLVLHLIISLGIALSDYPSRSGVWHFSSLIKLLTSRRFTVPDMDLLTSPPGDVNKSPGGVHRATHHCRG